MRCLVTGAAGFIGSHLVEELLRRGHDVTGLDAFVPYYDPAIKTANLAAAWAHDGFRFKGLDLRTDPLGDAVAGAEVVFHLAAMPGLVRSWSDFPDYLGCNVTATQRLLESLRQVPSLKRLIYASTSSVYGADAAGDESLPTRPVSPYGVTKLAAEHLCSAYAASHGLPLVTLRYFSVYGPRQRPDMGYHKFIQAMQRGEPVEVTGDGRQVRGNTYVSDCVEATVRAIDAPPGEVYNVGGGESASVWDVIRKLEALAGRPAEVRRLPPRPGDQQRTAADTTKIRRALGWAPATSLDDGLAAQWHWQAEAETSSPPLTADAPSP